MVLDANIHANITAGIGVFSISMVGEETNGQPRAVSSQRSFICVQCLSSHTECSHSLWGKTAFFIKSCEFKREPNFFARIASSANFHYFASKNIDQRNHRAVKFSESHKALNIFCEINVTKVFCFHKIMKNK